MSFIEKNLSLNERIYYVGKLHWFIFMRGLFLIGIGLLCSGVSNTLVGFLVFLGVLSLIVAGITASSTEFAITNKRVVLKTGALKRKFMELQLNKSEGLRIEQGVLGRIFNFGTVKINSAGVSESFTFLANPFQFKKEVNNAIEASSSSNSNS